MLLTQICKECGRIFKIDENDPRNDSMVDVCQECHDRWMKESCS